MMARNYNSYSINGCTYHTKSYAVGKTTQCDGVCSVAKTSSFSSAKDKNPSVGEVTYYGRITQIVELNYSNEGHVVLFKCDWVKRNGVRILNDFGITEVNFNHVYNSEDLNSEPYILASQAKQVYYVNDPVDIEWNAVVVPTTRDFFDMDYVTNTVSYLCINVMYPAIRVMTTDVYLCFTYLCCRNKNEEKQGDNVSSGPETNTSQFSRKYKQQQQTYA